MPLLVDVVDFKTNWKVDIITVLHFIHEQLSFRKVMQVAI